MNLEKVIARYPALIQMIRYVISGSELQAAAIIELHNRKSEVVIRDCVVTTGTAVIQLAIADRWLVLPILKDWRELRKRYKQ